MPHMIVNTVTSLTIPKPLIVNLLMALLTTADDSHAGVINAAAYNALSAILPNIAELVDGTDGGFYLRDGVTAADVLAAMDAY